MSVAFSPIPNFNKVNLQWVATPAALTADTNDYLFTAAATGTPSPDRYSLILVGTRRNLAASVTAVAVGAVALTAIDTINDTSGGADIITAWIGKNITNSSDDIRVQTSANMLRCAIDVFQMTGWNGVAPVVVKDTTESANVYAPSAISAPADGALLACVWRNASPGTASTTWGNITERGDVQPETAGNGLSTASDNYNAAASVSVTATSGGTGSNAGGCMVMAFAP